MFKKSIVLACIVSMSLSVSAVASAIKDKVLAVSHMDPVKIIQLKATPELNEQSTDLLFIANAAITPTSIMIFDYGAGIERQSSQDILDNCNFNVFTANVAKVQNQNFERMLISSNS